MPGMWNHTNQLFVKLWYHNCVQRSVLIFHGRLGDPKENWFPWLKEKLEKNGHKVFIPQFPTPKGESLESWLKVLDGYRKYIDKNTIFIGHSRGARFLLHVLERLDQPVYAAFFIGGSVGIKQMAFAKEAYRFADGYHFNWKIIKSNAKHFFVYHSDNDPYVHLDNAKEITKKLKASFLLIPNAGHFNTQSGYTKFEKLYTDILSIT